MRTKFRLKIKRSEKTKKNEIKNRDFGKLNKKEVQEEIFTEVTANVQITQLEKLEGLNEIGNEIEKRNK